MYIYKAISNTTQRTFIGLSVLPPWKSVALKFNLAEKEEGLPPFERDLLTFGKNNFSIIPICEMNSSEKAKKKANHYISEKQSPYNTFYYEVKR